MTHRLTLKEFPVLVIYEVVVNEILVLNFLHAHSHPRRWRRQLE